MTNAGRGMAVGLAVVALGAGSAWGQNWPSFRGENGSGIGTGSPPATWNVETGENVRWKARIEGLGHSSPIVWGERVIVTTAVSLGGKAATFETGWLAGTGDSAADEGEWAWKVICLDKGSGRMLWEREAKRGVPRSKRHLKATHANSSPATDGRIVVAYFGSEGLYAYDMEGKELWQKDLGVLDIGPYNAPELEWGCASSPILHEGLVIVQVDALNGAYWVALRAETGEEVRRVERKEVATWATPSIATAGGRTQVVCNGWKEMAGYDLATGERLWTLSGGGDVPVPRPVVSGEMIYLTNGHGRSPVYAVRAEARGDLTPKESSEERAAGLAWHKSGWGSYMPTPIVVGDELVVASDNGVVTAMDARTGEKRYRERIKDAGTFSASAVAADGRIYLVNEEGTVIVLRAGSYEEVARNAMGEACMATPAIAEGVLLIRGKEHLYCIGETGGARSEARAGGEK